MIEQNVQVLRCQGDSIWLRLGVVSGCTACDRGNGCGAGVFARLLKRRPVTLKLARRDVDVRPGQMVTLAIPESVYLRLVFDYYGWPLLAAIVGAFAGFGVGDSLQLAPMMLDATTFVGGVMAVSLVWVIVKKIRNRRPVLKSPGKLDYFPSATPGMCDGAITES